MFCFCCAQILLALAYYIKKTSTHGHGCSKNLPRSQNFTNNWFIQHPPKQSLEPPESISAFPSMVGNTKRVFTILTLWFCTNCMDFVWLRGMIFQKLNTQPDTQQPEIFHTCSHFNQFCGGLSWSTNKSRWYGLNNKNIILNSV